MIDEDIMEKIIPIPDEEEEMENIEAELAEADFPITNFKKGGVFYHIIRMFVTLFIELKQLARTILNSCFILHAQGDWSRCTLPLSLPEKAMFGNIGRERPGCQQRCNSGRHILRSEPMRLRATHQRSTCACARLIVATRALRGM